MNFDFTDAWILHSIHYTESFDSGADLISIISYADYINHAIITFSELEQALQKLISAGIVQQENKFLSVTETYRQWWENKFAGKGNLFVEEILSEVELYLKKFYKDKADPEAAISLNISENDFRDAVSNYLNK